MGLFGRKIPKPKLHKGTLVEMELTPKRGKTDERTDAVGGRGQGVVWVTFRARKITSGKNKGNTTANVVAVNTGEVIGSFDVDALRKRKDVQKLLGKVTHATCYLESNDADTYAATVRFGPHKFMPKPFW